MTRSGRCYARPVEDEARKGKEKASELEPLVTRPLPEPGQSSAPPQRKEADHIISEKEACEFLKIIKHSEYSVIDQLNRLPAKISILSLLLNSEAHRKALLRILGQAYVAQDISVENLDRVVGSITTVGRITFTDEEIPAGGRGSMKALYISARCKEFSIGRILIDNGSALNIMPYATLRKLPVDVSYIRPNPMMVKAFDGTKRAITGDIEITLKIGPVDFEMTFQVMDIHPSYSCLLGRPWIHLAGAVPSTLHQVVKFRVDNRLIQISAESDIMVSQTVGTPYIEAAEEAMEDSFRSFEVAEVLHLKEGAPLPQPHVSKNLMMQLRQLAEKGWKAGCGLGKRLQGIKKPVTAHRHDSTFGLGYKPSKKDRMEDVEKKRMKRLARLEGKTVEGGKMEFPPLFHTFRSAGWTNPNALNAQNDARDVSEKLQGLSVLAVGDEEDVGHPWVYPAILGPDKQDWTEIEFPVLLGDQM